MTKYGVPGLEVYRYMELIPSSHRPHFKMFNDGNHIMH